MLCKIRQHVTVQELSGSLGDLGTFLPLVVALSATVKLDFGTTLLFTGLYNILSGFAFRIPMCVQPMKTIAAVALATPGLSIPEAMAAGLFVSVTMLLLGLTGLMDMLNALVPTSVVRGIQLAVGLSLAQKGLGQAFLSGAHTYRHWLGADGLLLGLFCITFLLITTMPPAENAAQVQQQQEQPHPLPEISHCTNECQQTDQHPQDQHHLDSLRSQSQVEAGIATNDPHTVVTATALTLSPAATAAGCSRQHGCGSTSSSRSGIIQSLPSALLVVLLGLVITPIAHPEVLSGLRLGPSIPSFAVPSLGQLQTGIRKAGIAQLPLTSLNSVVAVSQLAAELFPARGAAEGWRWQPSFVASSVGLMNLLGVWFGAFPCCHGAGGLAAQYKFGARTGMAPVLLGGMKIILALVFGSSLLQLMQHFPRPLLGGMLLMSGLELASSARKQMDARGCSLMLLTAAAILGLQDTGAGFLVGLVAAALAAGYDCCSSAQHRQHVVMCWQAVALRLCACFRGSRDPQNHAAGVKYTPCASDV